MSTSCGGRGFHGVRGVEPDRVTAVRGWRCQDRNPAHSLLDPIAHCCSLCQVGSDSGSGKSPAIPATKWDSPGEKATTQPVLTYSSFFFFFFCRTCRGGLTPGREVESNAPLKSLVFAFATSFFSFFLFPPLAIYHDHLSMPINIIIQHRKSFEIIEGR